MTQTFADITTADVFDVRDVIARYENLGTVVDDTDATADLRAELREIDQFLANVAGNGGDEEWCGDWFPVTFIADTYFTQYARNLASDIGAIRDDASWPYTCIDWEQAANDLRNDYSSIEVRGCAFWYR